MQNNNNSLKRLYNTMKIFSEMFLKVASVERASEAAIKPLDHREWEPVDLIQIN